MYSSCASSTCSWPSRVRACLAKDIEDKLGAVNHPGVDQLFDVALLRSGEVVVEQQQIGGDRSGSARDLLQLAASDQGRRVGTVAVLQKLSDDFRARTHRQRAQLGQRLFGTELGNVRGLGHQLCGGTVASRLGRRGQGTAPGSRGCRPAGTGACVKADEKRTLPGHTAPVRRRDTPCVVGFTTAGLTEGSGFWTAQFV